MRLLIAAFFLVTTLPLQAATQGAWASLDVSARKACERDITRIAAKARVRAVDGKVLGIGPAKDEDRFYAVLLKGETAGFPSRWLCLYDKRARTAVAREMDR